MMYRCTAELAAHRRINRQNVAEDEHHDWYQDPSPTALNPERNFSRVPARQPCLVTGPDRLQSNLCSRASRAHDKYGSTELLWVSVGIRMQLPDPGCQLGCEVWNDWSLVATRGNDDSLRPQHTVRGLQSKA